MFVGSFEFLSKYGFSTFNMLVSLEAGAPCRFAYIAFTLRMFLSNNLHALLSDDALANGDWHLAHLGQLVDHWSPAALRRHEPIVSNQGRRLAPLLSNLLFRRSVVHPRFPSRVLEGQAFVARHGSDGIHSRGIATLLFSLNPLPRHSKGQLWNLNNLLELLFDNRAFQVCQVIKMFKMVN